MGQLPTFASDRYLEAKVTLITGLAGLANSRLECGALELIPGDYRTTEDSTSATRVETELSVMGWVN